MNIEQLMYIVEVAKVRSLGEAAKTLNISQSALSQAIPGDSVKPYISLFLLTLGFLCISSVFIQLSCVRTEKKPIIKT